MKVVILAGGLGTRLSEETSIRPKPMVEIGGKPILWHIMKIYSHYGFNEFIICLGYKGYIIKEFFANYFLHQSDITIDLNSNKVETHNNSSEPWMVTLIDTGDATMTGGRILRVKKYIGQETFMLTYGDGVANVDIAKLVEFHKSQNKFATLTAVQPSGKFGSLAIDQKFAVKQFVEKPDGDGKWINGGFFVLEPGVLDYIDGDSTSFEKKPLEALAMQDQLMAYQHKGFWMPMDKLSDKVELDKYWQTGNAPWKIW
ncbi:MAG: glucose-1-phosphate cytidylyltransferase [Bacteroidota bacterium]